MATRTVKDEDISTVRLFLGEIHDDITKQLSENINGILSCQSIRENSEILVTYNKNLLDEYKLLSSIEELGYSVELKDNELVQAQLRIEGMHCNSCVSNICDTVMDLTGVVDVQLTFLDKLATITYDPNIVDLDEIILEIEKLSFQVAISNAPPIKSTTTQNHTIYRQISDEINVIQSTESIGEFIQ
jgi:Cu+-exporting ATPase